MTLRIARGKERVIVWRINTWISKAHLPDGHIDEGRHTRCGRVVDVVTGPASAVVETGMAAEQFTAVGCGICNFSLVRELRQELLAEHPSWPLEWKETAKELPSPHDDAKS